MTAFAYYNEIDPYAAQWLRNLISAGLIAPGVVDERSIIDVKPEDLKGFVQCHFFAGIGIWSSALRDSGWPDDKPVWTGSCPCQPFSNAGQGKGTDDDRHLFPTWAKLIDAHRPSSVFGEQVISKLGRAWFDSVSLQMENMGYTTGAVDFSAAGAGAPNIRQRQYFRSEWLANTNNTGSQRWNQCGNSTDQRFVGSNRLVDGMEHTYKPVEYKWQSSVRKQSIHTTDHQSGGMANTECIKRSTSLQRHEQIESRIRQRSSKEPSGNSIVDELADNERHVDLSSSDNLSRGNTDWLLCTDGKWRPVEPSTFPLADGIKNRMGKLRSYGNGLNLKAATRFIVSSNEAVEDAKRVWLSLTV